MPTETIRLITVLIISDLEKGEEGEGGMAGGGGRGRLYIYIYIYISLHCHNQNDSCIKIGAMRDVLMFHLL